MRFQLEPDNGLNVVRAVGDGSVRIGERELKGSFIVSAETIIEPWSVSDAASLDAADLEPVLALEPEVILLGTGAAGVFPPARLRAQVQARNIGFECMDTAAACRTYNILVSEGRRVAAALIL